MNKTKFESTLVVSSSEVLEILADKVEKRDPVLIFGLHFATRNFYLRFILETTYLPRIIFALILFLK